MKQKREIFWGVFLILGAIFILVAKMGFLQGVGVWSLILSVFFAAMLFKGLFDRNFFEIFFALAFLAIIWAEPLNITAITPWPVLGAAALLGVGCNMIFPKKKSPRVEVIYNSDENSNGGKGLHFNVDGEVVDETYNTAEGDHIRFDVSFQSATKYINSDNFKSADMDCSFGSLKVYFDNALIQGKSARVNLDNSFGSTEMYIPRTWNVVNNLDSSFGGVKEVGRPEPDGMHTLYLDGDNSFGGVTIHYI